jgi:hypothetical protein
LHKSEPQLAKWKKEIEIFLKENLRVELHQEKSKIVSLSKRADLVGFRVFYHCKLLRKRNIKNIKKKIKEFQGNKISQEKFVEILHGWNAYSKWGNNYNLSKELLNEINIHFS